MKIKTIINVFQFQILILNEDFTSKYDCLRPSKCSINVPEDVEYNYQKGVTECTALCSE